VPSVGAGGVCFTFASIWSSTLIEGYQGLPGSGKSYTLTARALEVARRGRQVWANYEMNHKNIALFDMKDLLELPPGLVVIDEAHLWFDARLSMKLPPEYLMKLSQTRKAQWDILYCSQDLGNVDKRLRIVTNWAWDCHAYFKSWNPKGNPLLFTAKCYPPKHLGKPKKHVVTRYRFFNKKVAAAFDTLQTLEQADHILKAGAAAKARRERSA